MKKTPSTPVRSKPSRAEALVQRLVSQNLGPDDPAFWPFKPCWPRCDVDPCR